MELVEEKWDEILETLRTEYDIKDMLFKTWLKPLKVGSVNDTTLTLVYPIATSLATNKDFVVKYITEHYGLQRHRGHRHAAQKQSGGHQVWHRINGSFRAHLH